jgi:uncharacterized membrane protein YphA (DoxX/SURF4 family)
MGEKIPLALLVPLRLYIGGFMLNQGFQKLSGDFFGSGELTKFLGASVSKIFVPGYGSFLGSVVFPNEGLFAFLVVAGEIGVGVSLILGLMVRVGAVVGMFLMANYYIAIGSVAGGGSQAGVQIAFFLAELAFLQASAGRFLGIDRHMKKKFPRSWLF